MSHSDYDELLRTHQMTLKRMLGSGPVEIQRRLFLSHASEEADIVRQFARDLRSLGVPTWLDAENLVDNENWMAEQYEALSTSCGFVLFLSPTYFQSQAACLELDFIQNVIDSRAGFYFECVALYESDSSGDDSFIKLYESPSLEAAKELQKRMDEFYKDYMLRCRRSGLQFEK